MSWLTKAIDAGGEYRNPLDDIEDALFLTSGARRAKTLIGGDIVIATFGPGAPPPVDSLKAAIRGKVPRRVIVKMVEGSGRTVQL